MAKFSIGDKVVHKLFGEGKILDIDGLTENAKLTIEFRVEKNTKVILSKFVKLAKGSKK